MLRAAQRCKKGMCCAEVDEMSEKWNRFLTVLRKMYLFPMGILVLWNVLVIESTLLAAPYNHMYLSQIPVEVLKGFVILYAAAGGWFSYRALRREAGKTDRWMGFLWNFGLSILDALFLLATKDLFYSFGGFMPGLEALGVYLNAVFTIILSVVGAVIWLAVMKIVRKKRKAEYGTEAEKSSIAENRTDAEAAAEVKNGAEADKDAAAEKGKKVCFRFRDFLNVLAFLGIILLVLYQVLDLFLPAAQKYMEAKELERAEKYRQYVVEKNTEEGMEDVMYESFQILFAAQILSEEENDSFLSEWADRKEVSLALERYLEVTDRLEVREYIGMINSFYYCDYRTKTVTCCYELDTIDRERNCYVDIYCQVIYNDDLEFQDVLFTEQKPGKQNW